MDTIESNNDMDLENTPSWPNNGTPGEPTGEEYSENQSNGNLNLNPNQNREQLANSQLNKQDNLDYSETQWGDSEDKDPSNWPVGDISIENLEGATSNNRDTNIANAHAESGNSSSIANP